MKRRLGLVLAAAVLLPGCPASVYQLNHLPDSTPLPQPLPISSSTDFTHTPSQYMFPLSVAGFDRVALFRYDTNGLDVSAGYNGGTPECPIRLTIYVAPTPRMSFVGADPAVVRSQEASWLNGAYVHWKQEIARGHPLAQLKSEDERTQDGVPGKKAIYTIGADESRLFVFVVDRKWFLTYRQSFPGACSAQADSSIHDFFARWRGRAG